MIEVAFIPNNCIADTGEGSHCFIDDAGLFLINYMLPRPDR